MMRTTITIDDTLFADLMQLTESRSRAAAINQAVADWVRRKKIEKLKGLRGKLSFSGDLADLRRLEVEEIEALDD